MTTALPADHAVPFIRAAGGVVWRGPERRAVAVIYRDRHGFDECGLPKGKLERGEDWEDAARREVLEETACSARIQGFGGLAHYYVGRRPKVVLFFEMIGSEEHRFEPSGEVRAMAWLPVGEALRALTHPTERDVLRRCLERTPQ